MNIVHFSAGRVNPSAAKAGTANVIYWLAREQAQAGHRISIAVLPEKADFANADAAGYTLREYRKPTLGGYGLDPKLLREIDSGELAIDFAHLHSAWALPMVAASAALRRRGIPYAVSSHGSFGANLMTRLRIRRQIYRRLIALPMLNHAAFVHVHSHDEVRDAKDFGVRSNLVIAEQGINLDDIPWEPRRDWLNRRFPEQDGAFKIVFLGRLDPWHKGIDLLLRGFAIALRNQPDMTLFLIGPEKQRYREQVPKLIAELGIASRVVMPGPVYELEAKYGALASADCFILTSRFEGFPLTVLEAMGCGTPVIVSAETNTADVVRDGGAGLISALSPEAIARCLLEMKSDPAARVEMRARARQTAEHYTWARAAAILTNAYENARGAR